MTKCPCKDCISLALCNAKLKATNPQNVTSLPGLVSCSVLHKYLNITWDRKPTNEDVERLYETRRTFKLGDLK